jgi:hypothetical protein
MLRELRPVCVHYEKQVVLADVPHQFRHLRIKQRLAAPEQDRRPDCFDIVNKPFPSFQGQVLPIHLQIRRIKITVCPPLPAHFASQIASIRDFYPDVIRQEILLVLHLKHLKPVMRTRANCALHAISLPLQPALYSDVPIFQHLSLLTMNAFKAIVREHALDPIT